MDVRIQQNTFLHYSVPFAVSLKSRKRKGTTTDSQVQKRLDCLLKKTWQILSKSTGRWVYRCYSCCYCSYVVTLSRKGSKKDTSF